MHQLIFYPVGNGDTSQIVLQNGRRILLDFRHQKQAEDGDGKCLDLMAHLRAELNAAKRDFFDVVAFTHADKDHIAGSTEFFEMRHRKDCQGSGRIKINELWVPAAMVLETATAGDQDAEFVLWRQEARHRLKEGSGVRVFSKPDRLKDWLSKNGLSVEQRRALITDAGQLVPGFSVGADGVEFFCHSPYVKHIDAAEDVLRNASALVFQVRFVVDGTCTDLLAVGDSEWEVLADIVKITSAHGNLDRLDWDLFNIPHHCSYLALAPEKGDNETVPVAEVKQLLLRGRRGASLISSSHPIPDTSAAYSKALPPHIQAKKAYVRHLEAVQGQRFYVTMEEPSEAAPAPLVFEISGTGHARRGAYATGASILVQTRPPRAG